MGKKKPKHDPNQWKVKKQAELHSTMIKSMTKSAMIDLLQRESMGSLPQKKGGVSRKRDDD